MKNLRFFLDFDGTISAFDVVDAVLERFALPEWRQVEAEWAAGRIGSRECLSRQLNSVRASAADIDAVLAAIPPDPGFARFLETAHSLGVPVAVVSDGFDLFIHRLLSRYVPDAGRRASLPVFSNRAESVGDRLVPGFAGDAACGHGCANCKPSVIRRESAKDDFVIFVGDGLSDRFAAAASDITFAKGKLLDFCRREGLKHRPYADFDDIRHWLEVFHKSRNAMRHLHLYS